MKRPSLARRLAALRAWRPEVSPVALAFVASLFASVACNRSLWSKLAELQNAASPLTGAGFLAGMFVLVTALQFILFAVLINRWTARPMLALLCAVTALTVYFMDRFGIYLYPGMIRNVAETDLREARDLLAPNLAFYLLGYLGLPLLALSRVRVRRPPWRQGWQRPLLALGLALLVAVGAFATVSRQLVPLMREYKSVRYLITPGNVIYSVLKVYVLGELPDATGPRAPIGRDAALAPRPAGAKPRLLFLVVGETQRAANWGLNGYERQTTPELARAGVINFRDAESCGTNTATSVPCMFSVYGRRDYDEERIRNSESLLNVLQHAGVSVLWRDNQSGCKGVCSGVEEQVMDPRRAPALCRKGECLDGILLDGLQAELQRRPGDLVVVIHLMGLHGPAYFQRYPAEFRRFTPTCDTTRLETCSIAQIVNTYDNGMLYSDHVIAQLIGVLRQASDNRDTALLFASDHGESLGENNLYLHSIPRAIAPSAQTHIPFVLWLSPSLRQTAGLREACLRARADEPVSHDHLFHSVLGLMGVRTDVYDPALDITHNCR